MLKHEHEDNLPEFTKFSPLIGVGSSYYITNNLVLGASISYEFGRKIQLPNQSSLKTETLNVFADAGYEHQIQSFIPYLNIGLGFSHLSSKAKDGTVSATISQNGFAFKAGAGLKFAINDNIALGLGYDFIKIPSLKMTGSRGTGHVHNMHIIKIPLSYKF